MNAAVLVQTILGQIGGYLSSLGRDSLVPGREGGSVGLDAYDGHPIGGV